MANLLWACATSEHYSPAVVDALCAAARGGAAGFVSREVASTAWALSHLRHYDGELMDLLGSRFAELLRARFPEGDGNQD